jgi:hypothetical protein
MTQAKLKGIFGRVRFWVEVFRIKSCNEFLDLEAKLIIQELLQNRQAGVDFLGKKPTIEELLVETWRVKSLLGFNTIR